MNPGTIVRCRNREWVLLPSDEPEVHRLPPADRGDGRIHRDPQAPCRSNQFRSCRRTPAFRDVSAADGKRSRRCRERPSPLAGCALTLREGATPFRSLGRISIRPRIYQFVPMLMALRLDPVRILIADDVGVGKTIEALLIARELFRPRRDQANLRALPAVPV